MTVPSLSETLELDDDSVVAAVGAGGKKTTLYRLAAETDGVVTATVRIPIFDEEVERVVVTTDPEAAADAEARRPLGLVPEREREDRYFGYDPGVVDGLAAAGVGPLLVKADGARNRLLKAPNDREPQIPSAATHVLPVASARVVGEPLSERAVHRPERVSGLADVEEGEEIRPSHVAAVLAHEDGGLKGVPEGARAVPVINMVDTPELAETGRKIARGVLDGTSASAVDRVLLTRMIADDPVVDTVER
ncbi:selenium cofactor biosynthesis protein YqeC [Halopelagius longus]|uniref:Probable selenium-dependent hydroxylase accessory protein YqeC n=1 Tax=Halopelagius longus TaxID=1236180 RepID=A0A1H1C471_9EURY|nr:selenium cofactor biosynthesis protein YqeC [Halopelagius longus]RDI71054.1 putative selenium-dependent hydroxylase accessory protein YqeC [Halopelagius longus]SDQ58840.1 probable selenium-dependent hydroxylase accessory protein YqeC [Halopelagius longus]